MRFTATREPASLHNAVRQRRKKKIKTMYRRKILFILLERHSLSKFFTVGLHRVFSIARGMQKERARESEEEREAG